MNDQPHKPIRNPGQFQTRSMSPPVIAYLIGKGCRITSIDSQGYLFAKNHRDLLVEYHQGAVVEAKTFAETLHRVSKVVGQIRQDHRLHNAAIAPLFGPSASI